MRSAAAHMSGVEARNGPALSVLHIVRQFHPGRGGLEDVAANLAREQRRLGHRVRVVTLDRLFSQPETLLPAGDMLDGVEIRRIPFFGSSRYPLAPQVFRHLAWADVLHVHAVDFFFDALALSRPFHRKPLIATTHGGYFHTADFSALKRLWFNVSTRLSANLYDQVVACSENDARQFRTIAPRRVSVIENGVDLAKFGGVASAVPVKRIVTIGRFSKNKRLDRLIAAFAALVRRDGDWRLDIIGAESDLGAGDLQREIAAAGVEGRARVHVGLDDAEIARVLKTCSVFASASEFEGFGVALIEAMSAGLLPVVHPNASFVDLADRHDVIVLADFAEPEQAAHALADAYQTLLAAPQRVRAAAPSLQRYAWTKVASQYLAAYRKACAVHDVDQPESDAQQARLNI